MPLTSKLTSSETVGAMVPLAETDFSSVVSDAATACVVAAAGVLAAARSRNPNHHTAAVASATTAPMATNTRGRLSARSMFLPSSSSDSRKPGWTGRSTWLCVTCGPGVRGARTGGAVPDLRNAGRCGRRDRAYRCWMTAREDLVDLEKRGWRALSDTPDAADTFYAEVLDDEVAFLLPGGLRITDRDAALAGDGWRAVGRLRARGRRRRPAAHRGRPGHVRRRRATRTGPLLGVGVQHIREAR